MQMQDRPDRTQTSQTVEANLHMTNWYPPAGEGLVTIQAGQRLTEGAVNRTN